MVGKMMSFLTIHM
jgi:hypothetical protein